MKRQKVKGYGTPQNRVTTFKDTFKVIGLSLACIAAIGITYLSVNISSNDKSQTEKTAVSVKKKPQITGDESDTEEVIPDVPEVVTEKSYAESESVQAVNEDDVYGTEPAVNASADIVIMSKPLSGKLIKEYSINEPIYSKTLDDRRIHKGIDISAQMGSTVCACASGVVEEAKKDILYGYTIAIDHGNGVKSIYSNLTGTAMVQVGKDIKKGEPIGMVGDSAICETSDESHLHFEIMVNEENVNPLNYFSL